LRKGKIGQELLILQKIKVGNVRQVETPGSFEGIGRIF
jgi:hypothetical protein